jgi:hypothetical protein
MLLQVAAQDIGQLPYFTDDRTECRMGLAALGAAPPRQFTDATEKPLAGTIET